MAKHLFLQKMVKIISKKKFLIFTKFATNENLEAAFNFAESYEEETFGQANLQEAFNIYKMCIIGCLEGTSHKYFHTLRNKFCGESNYEYELTIFRKIAKGGNPKVTFLYASHLEDSDPLKAMQYYFFGLDCFRIFI